MGATRRGATLGAVRADNLAPRTGFVKSTVPRVLLAVAVGALLAAGAATLSAAPGPATGVVSTATVTVSAGCASGGRDRVAVRPPGAGSGAAPVPATLDACGQPQGSVVSVQVNADGRVGTVVSLAGTRAPRRGSPAAALVLGGLVLGGAGVALWADRAGRAAAAASPPVPGRKPPRRG